MEQQKEETKILDLISRPALCVQEGIITQLNLSAKELFLQEGMPLAPMLKSGAEEYAAFSGGVLYLTLSIHGHDFGASVIRNGDEDIFTLDQLTESEALRALALAAKELRAPLTEAMVVAHQVADKDCAGHLNRSLYRILRIVGNMSDASTGCPTFRPEILNATAVFQEIADKAIQLCESTGIHISYTGPEKECICCFDRQFIERAVLNMISNAMKFTPKGGEIQMALRQNGKQFRFSVTDTGRAVSKKERATIFSRYLREPSIEDPRHGIGLGMPIIRCAAARHRGTVLVDCPEGYGTRVTLTFFSVHGSNQGLHSNVVILDYGGELDHTLIELSNYLPPELY